jgi:type II secretory pathway pseudopilin PulG
MAVCAIISILAAISFALIGRARVQAEETNALAALDTFATGYEMYSYHHSQYPQWGDGQRFSDPRELLEFMTGESYLPNVFSKAKYNPTNGYFYGITQDYALEIVEFDPTNPAYGATNTYFIILHPYNFQRDALAIGTNAALGWIAVRPRRGREGADYRTYHLFTPARGGAVD